MECYVRKKSMAATWEYWKDDQEMLGCDLFCFAISAWKLANPKEVERFEEEYKKSEKSA